jgi:phosphoribosylformimino-5-aminoimidazole carboxamide ribotide isomerase
VFGDRAADMARRWIDEGAEALHLVDLDGARSGRTENLAAVSAVVAEVTKRRAERAHAIVIDLGGGIRDEAAIALWLDAGIDRVILGTAAVENPELIDAGARRFPGCVWVGIDTRDGKVAVDGWTRTTARAAVDLARDAEQRGAAGIVYTDIGRDGAGSGVNVEATALLADRVGIPVFASGGVHSAEDVARLRKVESRGVAGVIVGRALYDGAVTLAALLEATR